MNNNKTAGALRACLAATLMLSFARAAGDWAVPEEHADKVDALGAEQRAFIIGTFIIML